MFNIQKDNPNSWSPISETLIPDKDFINDISLSTSEIISKMDRNNKFEDSVKDSVLKYNNSRNEGRQIEISEEKK